MKIYDTHSDILFNLYQRHMDGEQKIFERYHLNNLKKGGVVGGIWVVYSETDFDVFNAYKIALEEFAPYKNKFDVVYGLEGLRNVATVIAQETVAGKTLEDAKKSLEEIRKNQKEANRKFSMDFSEMERDLALNLKKIQASKL